MTWQWAISLVGYLAAIVAIVWIVERHNRGR